MKSKYMKKWMMLGMACVLSLAILAGCQSKTSSEEASLQDQSTSSEIAVGEPNSDDSVTQGPANGETPSELVEDSLTLDELVSYLGNTEAEMIALLDETPESIDEGGLAFQAKGIRVWFDDENVGVNQIFTQRKDLDMNGVALGDPIESFEAVFGQPNQQYDSDWHFAYGNVFISVNFDETSRETFAIYVLSQDF